MAEVIVKYTGESAEDALGPLCKIKYHLPLIGSYVLEIEEEDIWRLDAVAGVCSLHKSGRITAQMDLAREIVGADAAHAAGILGRGIAIAVLDTGIAPVKDLANLSVFKDFVSGKEQAYDDNGHGTHVAGIAAGSGVASGGRHMGIAPHARLVGVKVLGRGGDGSSSDVLAGIQWVVDNKERYNIRVLNLSVGTHEIMTDDPLVRGVEAAWDAGIVMTIAAGNNGPGAGSVTSPGVSRKVITVGCSDDSHSVSIRGEPSRDYSGRGPTADCIIKPDILAPGADIVSLSCLNAYSRRAGRRELIDDAYVRMSGTSMSTPMVSGAVALLLEQRPELSPDEVKLALKRCAYDMGLHPNHQGWGLLNIRSLLGI